MILFRVCLIWLLFALVAVVSLAGCSPANIQKEVGLEQALTPIGDLALALSGNGEFVPLNDAGSKALQSLQTDYAARTGISTATATQITNATVLGFQVTGNSKLVPLVPEATTALSNAVNVVASSAPASNSSPPAASAVAVPGAGAGH
jgi:hypothetical protein